MKMFCMNARRLISCALPLVLSGMCSMASGQTQDTTVQYSYDANGNVTAVSDGLAHTQSFSYDLLGRPVKFDAPATPSLWLTFDGLDQLTQVKDPRGLTTIYGMDGLGNRNSLHSPDTSATSYTFNEDGSVATATDARGKVSTYQYDSESRLTSVTYQSGTPTVFEYDGGLAGTVGEIGNLTKITDESGFTLFTHDLAHRVLTREQNVSTAGANRVLTVRYEYGTSAGANGQLEAMTYPSGVKVNYHYDASGRVDKVSYNPGDGNGGTNLLSEVPLLMDITYGVGSVQGWTWGNGVAYARTYDLDGRLTSYPVDLSGNMRTVSYNAASLVTGYAHTGTAAQFDQKFGYDQTDRLTSFTLRGLTTTYTYDSNGNRTTQTGPMGTLTVSASSNALLATTTPAARSFTYDAAGNRTGDGRLTYTYSDRGRLSHVGGITNIDMVYNGLGQRVAKVGVAPTWYAYDERSHTIGTYRALSPRSVETIYLGDMPVAVVTPTEAYYVLPDHLDAPMVLARADKSIVWDWRGHDPFGNGAPVAGSSSGVIFGNGTLPYPVYPVGSSSLIEYDHRFPGQIADIETGLFVSVRPPHL